MALLYFEPGIVLLWRALVQGRVLSNISGLYPIDARSIPPSCHNGECLVYCQVSPRGEETLLSSTTPLVLNCLVNSDLASSRFPGGSDNKEFACNMGDWGLISGLGRSPGGGKGNPL